MSRTLRISRDLKLLEKYCNTTADKIRAKIKRQREVRERMTAAQKEQERQMRQMRMKQERQMRMNA